MLTPGQRIFAGAVIGGAVGFAGGIAAAIGFTPHSNLAPLAAYIVTGPVGAIAGAVVADRENELLLLLWSLTLLVTLAFEPSWTLMALPLALQLLFCVVALRFPSAQKWTLFAVFLLTAAASVFPPVARDGHLAGFASIFDARLDASRHVPELVVQRWLLLVEWVIAGAIAVPTAISAAQNKSAAGSAALHTLS